MKGKSIFPKVFGDWIAFLFLVFVVFAVPYFELFNILPSILDWRINRTSYVLHFIAALYIVFNIAGNFIKIIVTDTTCTDILPAVLARNWRFCPVCESNSPPRSYHCKVCKKCVLRRDHHCTFTGCCIGFQNYRYYYMFLLHSAIGSFYATVLNLYAVWDFKDDYSVTSLLQYILPVGVWLIGYIDITTCIRSTLCAFCLYAFLFVFVLLFHQASLILKNQTAYEKSKNNEDYNTGHKIVHVKEYFGARWYLVWLSPFFHSTLPGDGITFIAKHNFKQEYSKNR